MADITGIDVRDIRSRDRRRFKTYRKARNQAIKDNNIPLQKDIEKHFRTLGCFLDNEDQVPTEEDFQDEELLAFPLFRSMKFMKRLNMCQKMTLACIKEYGVVIREISPGVFTKTGHYHRNVEYHIPYSFDHHSLPMPRHELNSPGVPLSRKYWTNASYVWNSILRHLPFNVRERMYHYHAKRVYCILSRSPTFDRPYVTKHLFYVVQPVRSDKHLEIHSVPCTQIMDPFITQEQMDNINNIQCHIHMYIVLDIMKYFPSYKLTIKQTPSFLFDRFWNCLYSTILSSELSNHLEFFIDFMHLNHYNRDITLDVERNSFFVIYPLQKENIQDSLQQVEIDDTFDALSPDDPIKKKLWFYRVRHGHVYTLTTLPVTNGQYADDENFIKIDIFSVFVAILFQYLSSSEKNNFYQRYDLLKILRF